MRKISRKKKERKVQKKFDCYYMYWLTRMLYVASSAIEWVGLPEEIDTVYLENCLNRAGAAILMRDPVADMYAVGQNASVGPLDIYGYPKDRRVIFLNGQTVNTNRDESVIIYNNSMRSADLDFFDAIARRLADTDAAVDINMQSQKTMPIIPVTEQQRLTFENIYTDIVNNIPYILVDNNGVDVTQLREALTFDNRKSFTSDLMISVQREIWNRFLTYVGVNNVNIEKRERTNVPEINSNLDEIFVMRRNRLNARERACQLINQKWGLDVSVRYYSEGGGQFGGLYSGNQDDMSAAVPDQSGLLRPGNTTGAVNRYYTGQYGE